MSKPPAKRPDRKPSARKGRLRMEIIYVTCFCVIGAGGALIYRQDPAGVFLILGGVAVAVIAFIAGRLGE